MQGILVRGGYAVVPAEPQHALALLDEPGESFALIVTNTPGLFADHGLRIPLLYTAASPDLQWLEKFPHCRALAKPFHPQQLLDLARELLNSAHAAGL
jgi:hypothetical protein